MTKSKWVILFWAVLLVGCATYSEIRQMDKFEETAEAYKKAITWSEFDVASSFIRAKDGEEDSLNLEPFKAFKVASYDLKRAIPSADKTRVIQIVEISYFRIRTLVLKSLSDRQVWEYDDAKGHWFLKSGLPNFK
jgi:hypothetical protein